jgi:predicted RNase H-like HicB family nuclease
LAAFDRAKEMRAFMAKRRQRIRQFTVILERDEDGLYVASVPMLKGCHTQGKTLDQVMRRIREAVELWLEVHQDRREARLPVPEFVGIQQLEIPA